ncbi:hypothetical protein L596_010573 [Steinernema carpocapsae]|uniref:Uncharacterized protein n=1 Tax=Steinernema carpocapsae TaxID=34508 RepID=A0A4U5PIQ9_STECR|nr:hypothetical protein L596_010573 [Steinernema carpocapsae]
MTNRNAPNSNFPLPMSLICLIFRPIPTISQRSLLYLKLRHNRSRPVFSASDSDNPLRLLTIQTPSHFPPFS